jgi:hypothetical protein
MTESQPKGLVCKGAYMANEDLPSLIFNFLTSRPATIKADILLWIAVYAAQVELSPKPTAFELEKLAEDYLLRPDKIGRIGSVICSTAVLDYVLENYVAEENQTKSTIESISALDETLALQLEARAPLRARHFRQALAEWRDLRATVLIPQTIRDFEKRSLHP